MATTAAVLQKLLHSDIDTSFYAFSSILEQW